jgi:hypothetical protein
VAPTPDPPDLAGAAERLRRWLDDLAVVGDGPPPGGLEAWHQAHGGNLIAAALALEALAVTGGADFPA